MLDFLEKRWYFVLKLVPCNKHTAAIPCVEHNQIWVRNVATVNKQSIILLLLLSFSILTTVTLLEVFMFYITISNTTKVIVMRAITHMLRCYDYSQHMPSDRGSDCKVSTPQLFTPQFWTTVQ